MIRVTVEQQQDVGNHEFMSAKQIACFHNICYCGDNEDIYIYIYNMFIYILTNLI